MKKLAIIPARSGSKRIPRKNIKDFLGKPIIGYSIDTALQSDLFDEVMVSTDDEEVAEISREYGAKVPFMRSKENADDHAILNDVIEEVIDNYYKRDQVFDYTCCILATAPLLQSRFLVNGFNLIIDKDFDSVRPIVEFEYPIQKAFELKGSEVSFISDFDNQEKSRSQDLEKYFHDAGLFYWMKSDLGLKGENRGGFEIPRIYSQDIDDEQDWGLCVAKYQYLYGRF